MSIPLLRNWTSYGLTSGNVWNSRFIAVRFVTAFVSQISHRKSSIITYVDIKKGKTRLVSLLTNDMDMEVEDIADIYRKRWEIELLFKQLKQNFPLRYFYGESANAIKIQIWVTLIANLLLMVMQRRIKRSWSFSNLATMFRIMLMYYVNCYTFLEHPERDWLKIIEMDNPQSGEPTLFD